MTVQKNNLLLISALVFVAATNDSIVLSQALAEESTYGPVKQGELIGNIAGKVAPNSSVSRQQVILGLLKANPQAFKVSCNFNSLKVGEKLRIPPLSDIQAVSQADAKKEYNRQNVEWKNRGKPPIVCATATTQSPPAVAPKAEVTPSTATYEEPIAAPTTPPAVSANQTAPKTDVKLVPEEQEEKEGKPAEPKPVATTTASSPSGPGPTSTETTPQPYSALILGILTIGGLLSALIIGWLLHKHGKQSAKSEESLTKADSDFSSEGEQIMPDNMPLHTDIKEPKVLKEEDKFKI
jgi:FimV-like protein